MGGGEDETEVIDEKCPAEHLGQVRGPGLCFGTAQNMPSRPSVAAGSTYRTCPRKH